MTCSFSTANLLSRDKDLRAVRDVQQGGEIDQLDYVPIDRLFLELVNGFNVDECMSD